MKTTRFDAADYLLSEEDCAAYLSAALEEQDPAFFVRALGTVARARGMTAVARETGLGRESLYKTLSGDGDPRFATIARIMEAVGMRFVAEPVPPRPADG
jgi:probable addiction module antidote protein